MKKLIIILFISLSVFANEKEMKTFKEKKETTFKSIKEIKIKEYQLYAGMLNCIESTESKADIRKCEQSLKAKLRIIKKEYLKLSNN